MILDVVLVIGGECDTLHTIDWDQELLGYARLFLGS